MNLHNQNNFRRWWDSLSITDRIFADGLSYLVWVCIIFLIVFLIGGIFPPFQNSLINPAWPWSWWALILVAWLFVLFIDIAENPYKHAWTFKEREEWDKHGRR